MDLHRARDLVDLAEQVVAHERADDADGWHERLEARADELSPAIDTLLGAGDHSAALRLVGAISHFCQDAGLVEEGRALAHRTLALAGDAGTDPQRARAWLTLGELAFRQGDQAVALDATGHALDAVRSLGDDRLELRVEFNLARIAFRDGEAARIRRHAERMVELAGDDPRSRFGATHMLAWAEHTAGNVQRAIELFEQNVETAHAVGNAVGEASELLNLGSLAVEAGHLDRAATYLSRGLDIAEATGSSYLIPGILCDVGRLVVLRGRTDEGLRLIAAGERQYERAGLHPDPGDDAFEQQKADAIRRLGSDRAAAVLASGAGLSAEDALALARSELSTNAG